MTTKNDLNEADDLNDLLAKIRLLRDRLARESDTPDPPDHAATADLELLAINAGAVEPPGQALTDSPEKHESIELTLTVPEEDPHMTTDTEPIDHAATAELESPSVNTGAVEPPGQALTDSPEEREGVELDSVTVADVDVIGCGEGGNEKAIAIGEKIESLSMLALLESSSLDLAVLDARKIELENSGTLRPGTRVVVVPIAVDGMGAGRNAIRGLFNFKHVTYAPAGGANTNLDSLRLIAENTSRLTFISESGGGATGSSGGPEAARIRSNSGDPSGSLVGIVSVDPIDPYANDLSRSLNVAVALARTNTLFDLWLPFDNMREFGESWSRDRPNATSLARPSPSYRRRLLERLARPSPSYRRRLLERRDAVKNRPVGSWCMNHPEAPVVNEYVARIARLLVKAGTDFANILTLMGELTHPTRSGAQIDVRWAIPHLWPLNEEGLDPQQCLQTGYTIRDLTVTALTEGSLCSGTAPHTAWAAVILGNIPDAVYGQFFDEEATVRAAASVLELPEQRIQVYVRRDRSNGPLELAALLVGADWDVLRTLRSDAAHDNLKMHLQDRFDQAADLYTETVTRLDDAARIAAMDQAWQDIEVEFGSNDGTTGNIGGISGIDLFEMLAAMGEAGSLRTSTSAAIG